MAAYELDPVFSLALKLLHSKSRDSADQLRLLLEEVTKQKYGGMSRMLPTMKRISEERFESSKSGVAELTAKSSSTKTGPSIQQPALHVGLPSVSGAPVLPHSKVEDVGSTSDPLSGSRVIGSRPGSDGSESDDADDLALEILEEDLTCVVCRGMDVGVRNRLVECVECHSLYHQECHRPPIQESHASDPRRVWTCSSCAKPSPSHQQSTAPKAPPMRVGGGKPISCITTKKIEPKSQSPLSSVTMQQSPLKSGSSSNSTKSSFSSSSSSTKGSSSSGISKGSSSKGVDANPSSKSSTLSSSSLTSSGGSSTGSSGSSSSANSGSKVSSSKIAHADKRIQIMKKKAAKMQEKRKLSK